MCCVLHQHLLPPSPYLLLASSHFYKYKLQAERRALLGHYSERRLSGVRRVPCECNRLPPTVVLSFFFYFSYFFFFSRTPVLPSRTTVSVPSLMPCPDLKCPLPSQDLETIDTARAGAGRVVAVYQTSLLHAFQLDQREEHTTSYLLGGMARFRVEWSLAQLRHTLACPSGSVGIPSGRR